MKTRVMLVLCAAGLTACVAISSAGAESAGNEPFKKDQKDILTADCINELTGQKEGTFAYNGATVVWPPNHKYRTAHVSLTDEDAETLTDAATITVTGTHDQIVNGVEKRGSGGTDVATDVVPGPPGAGTPTATTDLRFRGERSGTEQDGRTYTFTADGTTDNGTSNCEAVTFEAVVPHDQGN
jgi:hypothetical protein